MTDNKNDIEQSLNEIKKVLKEEENLDKVETGQIEGEEFILLDDIVSSPKNTSLLSDKIKKEKKTGKKKYPRKKSSNKSANRKILNVGVKVSRKKDPIANVIDKEIKPIIKKWMNKNLRSFVKKLVIEEMKQISKATEKPTKS
tara:strand:- start:340 stop:768 length:429 start_codon:yes stop_codon:yes gene_type:complete